MAEVQSMRGEKLFTNWYEPELVRQNIKNVVLRVYTHIIGLATDDPNNSTELIFTPRIEVDARMDALFSEHRENRGISITSLVSVGTHQKYLFLLDCGLSISANNEMELQNIIRNEQGRLKGLTRAMILRTVNSYHIVGFTPLSKDEWQDHMAHAILMRTKSGESVADVRYIGHSLERGYGSLRLSDYQGKPTPDFICYL